MSDTERSANNNGSKRSLPSWTSSRDNEGESSAKKPTLDDKGEKFSEGETPKKKIKVQNENGGKSSGSSLESKSFNKLLEGVVFVLSGFVNPERGMLRSRAMEMGAEYKPDWNSDCTLLVCAFQNTPKFRQVEADCGTIVSKDWILECYTQRKLIEIDSYLFHAGKPWRKGNGTCEVNEDKKTSVPKKSPKPVEREQPSKSTASTKSKGKDTDVARKCFEPSEVKKWAIDDLNKTIQWLESQEEKPDPSDMTKIAAEGILTCLQDAICSIEEKKDIRKGTEEWMFLPRVVEELAKLDVAGNNKASLSREDLHRQALDCKRIYEEELKNSDNERKNNSKAQMRDLTGFVETRKQLLTLKSNHRMNWIGFAVAHHLNSNASKAIEILEAYEGTLEDDYPPENEWCEHGEMLLYKISLLEESGFFDKALEELRKNELKIVDKLAYKEQEVSLLVNLGRLEEGEKLYQALLSLNPDNYRCYEGLQKCVGLYSENGHFSPEEIDQLDALYKTLNSNISGLLLLRIPLDFLQGDKFQEAADNYIRPLLTKGVPSLFSDLSSLYNQPGKADILEQIILELENSIKTTGRYPGRMELEPPSTLMWILFFLAQHYDRRAQYEIALSKINEAIGHTPTVIDLFSVKSRVLKHAGDLAAAAAFADEARCMDLADRYVNSECVKRMLQADQVALAEKTAVLFTKDGDQHNNLHDMQCMWYELASAESYFRQGDLGLALKKFLAVEKHYADITEDQFDFHSYCLRKMTLRTYVAMLKFQDQLHSHAYFHKAAAGAIRCYIKLHDSPPKSTVEEDNEMSKLLPSQKKKMRQKQRKAEARAKKEQEEKNEESNASGISKSGKRHAKPVDPDPRGEKLLQVEDPLLEATKYLKLLQKNSPASFETHFLSFELYTRKQKILLALQAVKQLLRLDAEHPDSHRYLMKFFNKVGSINTPVTDSEKLIWRVLEAERQTISQLHGKSLFENNNSYLGKHEDSLMHRAAFGELLYILDPSKRSEAVKLIEESTNNLGPREWKLKDCVAVHKLLGTVLVDQDAALRWKVRCAEFFPYSTYFEGSHSSVSPNSALNEICKSTQNGSSNHSVGDRSAKTVAANGKLEAFKGLTI